MKMARFKRSYLDFGLQTRNSTVASLSLVISTIIFLYAVNYFNLDIKGILIIIFSYQLSSHTITQSLKVTFILRLMLAIFGFYVFESELNKQLMSLLKIILMFLFIWIPVDQSFLY
ncbi:uncharacterized protein LOC143914571 [Arctopsyche grandis]|uniref:uncharacterized protein LOC143914571 n=1 Tax=Arctopsyche grandis TaxID=121162 RepID=UPI00406D8201